MAKLKQRPQNFAQSFAMLTAKRQINYLDSDDGNNSDDDIAILPSRTPQKKHKMLNHHQSEAREESDQSSVQEPVQAPQGEVLAIAEEFSEESDDQMKPVLKPRHASAPPALGHMPKRRKTQSRQLKEPKLKIQSSVSHTIVDKIDEPITPVEDQSIIAITVPQHAPVIDKEVPATSSPSLPDTRELSTPESVVDEPSTDELEFQISKTRKTSNQAYLVKLINETKAKVGQAWRAARQCSSVKNKKGLDFSLNDVVKVSFDSDAAGSGKIVEIRESETSMVYVVIQWLYTRHEALYAGATKKEMQQWPDKTYCLSNHFQVVTSENLDGMSHIKVDEKLYWNASGKKDLRSMGEIDRVLAKQVK